MRPAVLFLACFLFSTVRLMAQQPVPNNSFEDGTGDSAAGWTRVTGEAERIFLQEFNLPGNRKDTQVAASGKYFMRLTTSDTLINGQKLADVGSIVNVFPYSDRPKYIVFKAMYLPKSVNDRFQVHLVFTRWNTATKKREIILNYGVNSDSNKAYYPWTTFSAPITFGGMNIPDTLAISLNTAARQASYGVGTTLWIDDVKLSDSLPDNVVQLSPPGKLAMLDIYPNPSKSGFIHIRFAQLFRGEMLITLYDLSGREVLIHPAGRLSAGMHDITVDVSSLKAGIYLCRMASPLENGYSRLLIAR